MSHPDPSPILGLLASNLPADISGARSANRFQFQLAWAICRIIQLHSTQDGYALILDFHEDVVELDDESQPTRVDFHQIKSKTTSGNWTVRSLTKREKGKTGDKSSILGKLVSHRKFCPQTRITNFVSNKPTNFKLSDNKKPSEVETYSLDQLQESYRDDLLDKIEKECETTLDNHAVENTVFTRTELSPNDLENQCVGRLAKFLESEVDDCSPTNAVYKTLKAELERRNNEERLPVGTSDLVNKKLFGKSHMNQLLALAVASSI